MTVVHDETGAGSPIGRSWPRLDSREKVLGVTQFAADLPVPVRGLLHARLVLSVYAHARIDRIDSAGALAVPGVVAVLTADDLPIKGSSDMRMFQPLARTEVVWAGQPVAIVVAESETAAEDGVDAVLVDYTPLEPVVDVEAAMRPGAPIARPNRTAAEAMGTSPHAAVGGGDEPMSPHAAVGGAEEKLEEDLSPNVIGRHWHRRGELDAAFAGSDAVVHGRFETNWVYQAYLEPHAATAWLDGSGVLNVQAATQGIFYSRSQVAKIFGFPPAKVRVFGTTLGGAFGSKILVAEPLAAAAALAVRRPVRLALTRREDFMMTNPASAAVLEVRLGARSDGHLTGLQARLVFDAGAFSEWTIESIAAVLIAGPYRWDAWDIKAYGVETNRVGTGSYRGPGGPQATFALESLLDELAEQLGMDPVQLRRRNGVREGDRMVDGEGWVRIGVHEILDALAEHPVWKGRHNLPKGEGVGLSVGVWPGGKAPAAAICRLEGDGTLTIVTGVQDMTGVASAFATIAAEIFNTDPSKVNVVAADTNTATWSPVSGGSVVTYSAGRAVLRAAEAMKEKLLRFASEELEIDPADLELVDGRVQPKGSPDRGRSVAELAEKLDGFGTNFEPVEGHGGGIPSNIAPSTSGHLAHVRVDEETGQVTVLDYVIAQDVGKALNPALVEGQMRGGATQGIGWALYEGMRFDDQGQLLAGSFMDYAVPSAVETPRIQTVIVEVPAPDGPFGAKGIGEAPVCGSAAAVANAVRAASGVRMHELPMTASRVWAASQRTGRGDGTAR